MILHYISLLVAVACSVLGVFVLSRNRGRGTNWGFALGMAALAVTEYAAFLTGLGGTASRVFLFQRLGLAGEILLPGTWLLFGFYLIRIDSPISRGSFRLGVATVFLLSALFIAVLDFQVRLPSLQRDRIDHWLSTFLILTSTAVLATFEATLRTANHEQRWRIKFLLLGVGAMLSVRIYIQSQHLLFPNWIEIPSALTSTVDLIGCGFIAFSLIRHQLLDVDVFVSRYFAYNSFTIFAVGGYLLAVGLTAQAIRSLGGSFSGYFGILFSFAAVLSLITILLSTRARKKVKVFIDRHFYRNRYDYHREWLSLTERLSSKLDDREIYIAVRNLFAETMWVENTRLWLCDDREREFRPVRLSGDPEAMEDTTVWNPRLVTILKEQGYPVTLDDLEEALQPVALEETRTMMMANGFSVLVPLITGNILVGILGCAKSRSGYSMDREDFDLMNTVARQAANNFLIARLSQNVIRAKELEAFHSFSAFVLHDMKNFVSMLSLVVQNADRNLDNPEFRKDAMRSISQTVEKMKRMMERLSTLAREPDVHNERVELDELVRDVALELNGSVRSRIVEKPGGPPAVVADPVEIRNVLTNLIMNAEEAMGSDGEIRLSTFARDGKSGLSVSDNGCGMTSEFVAESLFKPFTTTKSHGFGIGLYQVKKIVEAHKGFIEVDSVVGQGTTVRVLLPQAAR